MDPGQEQRLRDVGLFARVDASWLDKVAPDLQLTVLAPGDVLVHQGEAAEELFVLLSGTLRVLYRDDAHGDEELARLGPGSIVGEIALFTGERRAASVEAVDTCEVVVIPGSVFNLLLADHPDVAADLAAEATSRLRRTQLVAQIVRHFDEIDRAALQALEPMLDWVHLPSGVTLFSEGEPGDAAYLVVSGRLRVAVGGGDEQRVVAEIGRGEMVGEMALLDGADARNATVYAVRDSQLVRFPRDAVQLLLERFPAVVLHVARTVLRRSKRPMQRATSRQVSIAFVPVTSDVDMRDVGCAVGRLLGEFGPTEYMWSERVDHLLDRPGLAQAEEPDAGNIRLVQWLHEIEDRSSFLVFETDRAPTPWTRRVLRQSDHVVYVADAGSNPAPTSLEREVWRLVEGRRHPRTSLVLIHPDGVALPTGTASWLAPRPVEEVFHIRRGRTDDLARLARILSGRAVGLVLSGGGARGFAHLGMVRAMEELDIPIDLVGGTSIGSVIATIPALQVPPADRIDLVRGRFDRVFDYTLPLVSVLRAKRISSSIVEQFKDTQIEDLWLPFFCIATSITRCREVVQRRGSLAVAVRASVSIPGVMPPVPVEGELLVDGGVLDNLPVEPMRAANPTGTVIAVDVAPPSIARDRTDYGLSLSGLAVIKDKLRPGRRRGYPPLAGTILRSMLVASTRDRDRVVDQSLADLYVDLDASACGPFEFGAVARMEEVGYRAARPRLERWIEEEGTPWKP